MSFLTPLFLLGGLAIVAPIIFHLIRRTTKDETPFGSLMFLEPSPPRVSRRSRLENLPLLLLRAGVLIILAAAFARPFLREPAALDVAAAQGERVALLIDASASMRRSDLWPKAVAAAIAEVDARGPGDELAVIAFDASTRPILSFAEWSALDPDARRALARTRIGELRPSWSATKLGQALVDAAGVIEDVGDAEPAAARTTRRIVLISDVQQGCHLEALGDFEWPSDLELDVRPFVARGSNASMERLADTADDAQPESIRVRVSNDPDSDREAFRLAWDVDRPGEPVSMTVPPGESRVVRVPLPPAGAEHTALKLAGDSHSFDDTFYVATEPERPSSVLFAGPDEADDPEGLLYYLSRAYEGLPGRTVNVERRPPGTPLAIAADRPPALVVLTSELPAAEAPALAEYVNRGGTVLAVPGAGRSETLAAVAGVAPFDVADADVKGDSMLGEIDFGHPLFSAVSAPQFNDFTKIRFRKYRRLPADALGEARVVARFESGDPAVIEKRIGRGRLVVMTTGWRPTDGWLARSSKFIPLMAAMLDAPGDSSEPTGPLRVGDPIPLPEGATAVRKPDGPSIPISPGLAAFLGADAPGVYEIEAPGGPRRVAVNLDPSESRTAPLGVGALEQAGVRLVQSKKEAAAEPDPETKRQLQAAELEGRQKLWRPLILAALGVLVVETWLAGRLSRTRRVVTEAGAAAS
ncbi:BatA domain-containing protein [Paludisphaera rhizosphaerae]|uniref:BatA domain-containing protein n=1 Tax=Paludisphaera rhizosphaerae TaxID=2711216 RepID=UPI0013EA05C0|nr:BatA domain-containing protein [Paludisphaera rhizosphaerae]